MASHSDGNLPAPLGGFGVRSRICGDWLELSASPGSAVECGPDQAWVLLNWNAWLDGPVRVTLPHGARAADLRAEIWIEGEADLEARAAALGNRMRSTLHALRDTPSARSPLLDTPAADIDRLVQLCAEAGWPAAARAGDVTVDIDSTGTGLRARIERTAEGLRASVDLAETTHCAPASRHAVGLLLLATGAAVRPVKGTASIRDGAECAGLAVFCGIPESAEALDRALSALTVACGMAARETQALLHEEVALDYLAWLAPEPRDESKEAGVNHHTVEENTCLQQP